MILSFLIPLLGAFLPPDVWRNATEMVEAHGYLHEIHKVTTEDGYILTVIRVNSKAGSISGKIPVVVQHGLISGPENILAAGPPYALPFYLADRGYDVWIPANRGTTHSKGHVRYSTRDPAYWNFTFEEIGLYDYPAYLTYITKVTKSPKVHFIGHSQGATQMYAALSLKPDLLGSLLRSFIALGPVTKFSAPCLAVRFLYWTGLVNLLEALGIHEFAPYTKLIGMTSAIIGELFPGIGDKSLQLMSDYYVEGINRTTSHIFLAHYPQGGSAKNMRHLLQLLDKDGFYRYKEHPSDPSVPYDLSKIPAIPQMISQGAGDLMATPEATLWLHNELVKARKKHVIKMYPWIGHLGVIAPNNCCTGHLDDIYEFMKSIDNIH